MMMTRTKRRLPVVLGLVLLLLVGILSSPADARKRDPPTAAAAADLAEQQCDCEPSITAAVEESKTQLVATHQSALADVQAKLEAAVADKDAALATLRTELESVRSLLETSQKAQEEAEAKAAQAAEATKAAEAEQACRLELADTVAKQNEAIQSERSARSLLQQAEAESTKLQTEYARKERALTKERDTSRSEAKTMGDRYAETRRELMDAQQENRHLHLKLVSQYVNFTLIGEDMAQMADRSMTYGHDLITWTTTAVVDGWHTVRESTDAAVEVMTPVVRDVSEQMQDMCDEAKEFLAPHVAKAATWIGDGIGPYYQTTKAWAEQMYGDNVQPFVDDTLMPLYKQHAAPLVVRAGEVVESCRLSLVSGIEQGTEGMMNTISKSYENVNLSRLQWTHDNAEYCVRLFTYGTCALLGIYLFGAFVLRLAFFVIKVATFWIWIPCWLIYWIISKATGGGVKNKGAATANGVNGSHA